MRRLTLDPVLPLLIQYRLYAGGLASQLVMRELGQLPPIAHGTEHRGELYLLDGHNRAAQALIYGVGLELAVLETHDDIRHAPAHVKKEVLLHHFYDIRQDGFPRCEMRIDRVLAREYETVHARLERRLAFRRQKEEREAIGRAIRRLEGWRTRTHPAGTGKGPSRSG